MRVILTGARGQLGSDLVSTRPEGIDLLPLTRQDLDINDRERVIALLRELRPGWLVNTAAFVRVDDAESDAEEAFRVNALGVKNLAEGCDEVGATLVHISTDYVFDGRRDGDKEPYHEGDITNPINAYGVTKHAGEFFARNYVKRHYVVRTASLYGKAGASGKGGNFVFTILRRARKNETLRVVDDIRMSPTYSGDLAKALWGLLAGDLPYGVYHMANSGHCSWCGFARKIAELAGMSADIVPVTHTEYVTRARRPLWSPLTSTKGIALRSWESALESFIREVEPAAFS